MMSRYLRGERGGVYGKPVHCGGLGLLWGAHRVLSTHCALSGPCCALPVLAPTELLEVSGTSSGLLPLGPLNLMGDMIALTLHPPMVGKGGAGAT